MRQQFWAGLAIVNSLTLTVNCGGDDADSYSFNEATTGGTGGGANSGGSGGSAGTSTGGSAGERITGEPVACPDDITNLSTALAAAICEKRTECCEDDRNACVAQVAAAIDTAYPHLEESEDAETASLNCGAFDVCARAIHEANCDDWPLQSGDLGGLPVDEPECLAIITPKIENGDDCSFNYECVDGLCRVPESQNQGTCSEFANLNATCAVGLDCDPATMFCNDAHVCQSRLPNGTTCTDNAQCESRLCDVEASGKCLAPGPGECEYVPNGAEHCAISGVPGSGNPPRGLLVMAVVGLGVHLARRRSRNC